MKKIFLYMIFILGLLSNMNAEDKFTKWLNEYITPIHAPYWDDEKPIIKKTSMGTLKGVEHENISIFRGISYAKAPVDEFRFAPPVKIESWNDIKDATKFGSMCNQDGAGDFSEDCLSLNIWVPKHSKNEKLPVYFYIHGGGYTLGSGSQPLYEGTQIAKSGIIVVTINYRLNTLGFLPSQTILEKYGTTGNLAILDTICALEWVKDNIDSFGGNPKKITIGGESAGAFSVSALISSPKAKGLFQQAIMQSGALTTAKVVAPKTSISYEQIKPLSNLFFSKLGLEDNEEGLNILRKLPVKDILNNSLDIEKDLITPPQAKTFWPIFDDNVLPKDLYKELENGNINQVKLLFGFNTDEASIFKNPNYSKSDYEKFVNVSFGNNSSKIFERYPITNDISASTRLEELETLSILRSGMYLYADMLSKFGQDVYAYHFDYLDPDLKDTGFGVAHASELKYIFHNNIESVSKNKEASVVADLMYTAWTNFIKTGNPNGNKMLLKDSKWERYSKNNRVELHISDKTSMQPMYKAEDVDFINNVMHPAIHF